MKRPLLFAANWKMHHGPAAAKAFAEQFVALVPPRAGRSLWFFPPAVSLSVVASICRFRTDIRIGAQNIHPEPKGAFTGELSIAMAMEAGATVALVGHSERRHLFGETDEYVARKAAAVLEGGMDPIVCVGETLTERESGRTESVVRRQINAVAEAVRDWSRIVIAYEPVWAIGTGRTATPEDAAQVHTLIRHDLAQRGVERPVRILYGGSVNAQNTGSLLAREEIDGVLVGGASLDPEAWATLVTSTDPLVG